MCFYAGDVYCSCGASNDHSSIRGDEETKKGAGAFARAKLIVDECQPREKSDDLHGTTRCRALPVWRLRICWSLAKQGLDALRTGKVDEKAVRAAATI